MAQDRGDQVMAVGEHIRLDPDVLADDALDGEPPGIDLGPQALHDHADGIGGAARLGGASALGARGGYGLTPGEDGGATVNTGGSTLPRSVAEQHEAVRYRPTDHLGAGRRAPVQGRPAGVRIQRGGAVTLRSARNVAWSVGLASIALLFGALALRFIDRRRGGDLFLRARGAPERGE